MVGSVEEAVQTWLLYIRDVFQLAARFVPLAFRRNCWPILTASLWSVAEGSVMLLVRQKLVGENQGWAEALGCIPSRSPAAVISGMNFRDLGCCGVFMSGEGGDW